ncbi:transposase subunit [Reinekea sp. MED297]|uniref:Transposase subunit n=2 Tax=Reinekea TaxID=230494 RepID=A4B8W5_9GAMM|nr:transposase subunit [Reinekea sp. MED297] [Reinekea blandensis MED297]
MQQTIDQMKDLRLMGMCQALEVQNDSTDLQGLPFEERLSMLIDAETHERDERKRKRLLSQAKFKMTQACLEDVNYTARRGLEKAKIKSLSTCQWILNAQHMFITGPTGVGKSWLACAFGNQAIRHGLPVMYSRVSRLLEQTAIARSDGTLAKLRAKVSRMNLLILDDWGMTPFTDEGRQDLLEFIDDKVDTGSVLIASQLPVKAWYDYINEPTIADALLDRIVHRAHKIELHGSSMRKKMAMTKETK